MADLISFDIDGTLEVGEPSGSITIEFVRAAQRGGNLIGSCSDRPLSYQRKIWQNFNIQVDFTALKDRLHEVKSQFPADTYTHVGDTDVDEHFAGKAGFRFIRVDTNAYRAWRDQILRQHTSDQSDRSK